MSASTNSGHRKPAHRRLNQHNLTGADTWAVEAVPGESADNPFECHVQLQTRRGIWHIENLDLTQLVEDKAYEFLFVWSPLKIKGGTGSPGNPVALY